MLIDAWQLNVMTVDKSQCEVVMRYGVDIALPTVGCMGLEASKVVNVL